MNAKFAEFVNSIAAFHGTVDTDTDWLSPVAWTTAAAMNAAREAQLAWEEHGSCQQAMDWVLEAQALEESTL